MSPLARANAPGGPRDPLACQTRGRGSPMRILLLASAYNSLTQRVHAELADREYEVAVELALGEELMRQAVRRHDPDLIIAPMLTAAIPTTSGRSVPASSSTQGPGVTAARPRSTGPS